MGVATSSSTFFRQMGGTLAAAAFLSVLFAKVPGQGRPAFRTASQTPEFQAAAAANPEQARALAGLKVAVGAARP